MLEPVGPLSPTTYWIRRVVLIAVAVVVVLGLVWFVAGRAGGTPTSTAVTTPTTTVPMTGELAGSSASSPVDLTSSLFPGAATATGSSEGTAAADSAAAGTTDPPAGTAAATAATTPTDATPVPGTADPAASAAAEAAAAESASAQAAADAAASQAAADAAAAKEAADAAAAAAAEAARPRDAEGRLICPDASVQLIATVGSPTYAVGQQPIVGVTVTNVGAEPCVRDVSGSLQEYLAYDAAGARVWSTNDCLPGSGTDVRFLQPGESLQYNIKWSGTTSQPGCAAERTRVPAGEYHIESRIGSLVSSQATLTFQ